jgi:hypothetical protein
MFCAEPALENQRHPNHFHCHHQADQHGRPNQIRYQSWRSKKHCHGQGDLDHFPQKETEYRSTRIHGTHAAGQTPGEHRGGENHRQRAISGRPTNASTPGQTPGGQRHQKPHHTLHRDHPPWRQRGILFAQLARLIGGQRLEIGITCFNFRARSDCWHLESRSRNGPEIYTKPLIISKNPRRFGEIRRGPAIGPSNRVAAHALSKARGHNAASICSSIPDDIPRWRPALCHSKKATPP